MKFLILMSLVCVALATTTKTDNQKTIKSFNDQEIRETVCDSTVRREDFETIVTKLQKCLRQKRQEKLTTNRSIVRRSVEDKKVQPQTENMIDMIKDRFSIEKLIETFKTVVEQKNQHQTGNNNGKLNIVFGITQMDDEDDQNTIITDKTTTRKPEEENKQTVKSLKCEMKQTIKILSARMTTKKYEETCNADKQTIEALKDLNEQCDDTTNTMVKVIQKCENKNECVLNIETDLSGICECTQNKYLDVTYTCLSEEEGKTRSKRALHYRNRPLEVERERLLRRQIALAQGLDYVLDNFNYQLLYGGYGVGGYGGYGYGYGLPLYG